MARIKTFRISRRRALEVLLGVTLGGYLARHLSVTWRNGQGSSSFGARDDDRARAAAPKSATTRKAVWVCPMHPQIVQDHPGHCPICGMPLVQRRAGEIAADPHLVQVDTVSLEHLGVRLASATQSTIARSIQTYGTVALDQDSLVNVTAKVKGWVRKLDVTYVGQSIRPGQVLYEMYSPELYDRQNEYVDLLDRQARTERGYHVASEAKTLAILQDRQARLNPASPAVQTALTVEALVRDRARLHDELLNDGLSERDIARLVATRQARDVIPVVARTAGTATEINVRSGAYVDASTKLFSVARLSPVWIDVALYPDQLSWVRKGDRAHVTLANDQGEYAGHVELPDPLADAPTQALTARIVLDNAQGALHPGAYVDVAIRTQPHEALVVPRSAVMRSGTGAIVMLWRGHGQFLPVGVETGIEDENLVEITSGLQLGARVAVNGQFLLDAEASLADSVQRMSAAPSGQQREK